MPDLTGQIVLVHTTGFVARAIQFFESLTGDHRFNRWNHIAVMVDNLHCIGAEPGGAKLRPVAFFTDTAISSIPYTAEQSEEIVDFMVDRIGAPYAYEDIPLIAVALATRTHTPRWLERILSADGRFICSELADAALTAAGVHLIDDGRTPAAVYPSEIAKALQAHGWM